MSGSDKLQAFQDRLDSITSEASARNDLVGKHVTETLVTSEDAVAGETETLGEAFREDAQRRERAAAAGGWDAPSRERPQDDEDDTFGFEADQEFRAERPAPSGQPLQASEWFQPRRGFQAPPEDARRPSLPVDDDDDFANTDWTAE